MNELVFRGENGKPMTNSYLVAETFGKAHKNVLRDIDNLECSDEFLGLNFEPLLKIRELATGGKKQDRYYNITKDGFTFLAMGYTGKKAAEFKEKYIAAFNAMEQTLQNGLQVSAQFMQTQMQMMQQMMQLCNTVMQRLGVEPAPAPAPAAETAPAADDDVPAHRRGIVTNYEYLRLYYPRHVTVVKAAKELRKRGIYIRNTSLYSYLRESGYIGSSDRYYHRPSRECVDNGWMVCTTSGSVVEYPGRRYHTPHLSPAFVDLLERQLADYRHGERLPFGKEVES